MNKFILLFLIVIVISSCGPKPMIYNQELLIKKGMTLKEINEVHDDEILDEEYYIEEKEDYSYKFEINGKWYTAYIKYYTETYQNVINFSPLGNRRRNTSSYTSELMISSFYYIFEEDKIFWWGTIKELKNSEDELLIQIAKNIENHQNREN